MSLLSASSPFPLLRTLARAAGVAAALIGGLVLVSWPLDIDGLKSFFPGGVAMNPATALSGILSGAAVWLLGREPTTSGHRRAAQICAVIVAMLSALIVLDHALGWRLGLDQWLFREKLDAATSPMPNRMAPNTAVNFLLLGVAIFIVDLETPRGHRPAQYLVLLAALIALLAVTGYLYGVDALYGAAFYIPMALNTAIIFLLLCAGLFLVRPEQGLLMQTLTGPHVGSVMARRLLPGVIGIPLLIGWLRLKGQQAGFYGTEFGVALSVAGSIVILGALVWWSAGVLNRMTLDRVHAEEERDRFFNLSLDLLCIADFDGYFKQVNPAWEHALGWTREELLSRPYLELIHPDDRASTIAESHKLSSGVVTLAFENRYRCKDGSYRWFQWKAIPLLKQRLIYATARDVTEHKRAEEAVKESEQRLDLALDSAQMGAWDLDLINDTAVRSLRHDQIFGYQSLLPEWSAEIFLKHVIPGDREAVQQRFEEAFASGRLSMECRIIWPDQSLHWIAAQGRVYRNETGDPIRMMGVVVDITERKRAEDAIAHLNARLELSNKELEAFAYSVSHDLRAPLRAIDGFSQALLEDYAGKLDAGGHDALRRIRAASQRMAQLIDDMLNLSRVTRAEMRQETLDLSAMARAIVEELQHMQPERHVTVVIAPGVRAEGDARLLRVALENLLGNAWKFTSKQPAARIEVGATDQEGRTVYWVRDDGAGFDMTYADKLFGVFQRLHAMTDFPGTGVGLATVQRIIHRHGGRIWAESAVGQGATFHFTLTR